MTWYLLISNLSSVLLIAVFWCLAHQNALGKEPFGRAIALGYGVLAMLVLNNMLTRNLGALAVSLPISIMASKFALIYTLGLVALRLERLYKR